MAKICQAPDCDRAIFSNHFCQIHQYLRKDKKWLKTLLKRRKQGNIKPVSEKQSQKLVKYEKAKKNKEQELKKSGEWCCIFCGESFSDNDHPDWHHLAGRDGDLVFDDKYFWPAHTNCHIIIYHWGTYALLSSQAWYNSFLDRIKSIDIKLYNKELRRKERAI